MNFSAQSANLQSALEVRRIRAEEAILGMSARFGLDHEDFITIETRDNTGAFVVAAAYAGIEGLRFGSRKKIDRWYRSRLFQIRVGDTKVDSRKGMTYAVYSAMIDKAANEGEVIPDSPQASAITGVRSRTLLTGEALGSDGSEFLRPLTEAASVDENGAVELFTCGAGYDDPMVRFRPATLIVE